MCLLTTTLHCRALKFAGISLSDATTSLLHGRGMFCFLPSFLSPSLPFYDLTWWKSNCSDVQGDRPRPLPVIKELKNAIDITERKGSPSWDYEVSSNSFTSMVHCCNESFILKCPKMLTFASQDEKSCWMWKKPPPASKKRVADSVGPEDGKVIRIIKRQKANISVREKLLKGMVFNQFQLEAFDVHSSKYAVSMECILTMVMTNINGFMEVSFASGCS